MQHLVNALAPLAAKLFPPMGRMQGEVSRCDRQTAQIAGFVEFFSHLGSGELLNLPIIGRCGSKATLNSLSLRERVGVRANRM